MGHQQAKLLPRGEQDRQGIGVAGQAARLVNRETQNLTRLVNDLIEVTRFDSGTAALALDDVDVADVVRATLRMRGFTVLLWRDSDLGYALVSDLGDAELVRLGNKISAAAPQ